MVYIKGKTNKGGNERPLPRKPAPPCDEQELEEGLSAYVRTVGFAVAFNFGVYAGIPIGHAIRARGLLFLYALISKLLEVQNDGIINMKPLTTALSNIFARFAELVPSTISTVKYAQETADRIFTVLAHLRRLFHSPVRWRQASRGLSEAEVDKLTELVKPMGTRPGSSQASASPIGSPKKQLSRKASEISVDSDGFPSMLQSPTCSAPMQMSGMGAKSSQKLENELNFSPIPATKLLMKQAKEEERAALEVAEEEGEDKPSKKLKGKTANTAKVVMKRPAGKGKSTSSTPSNKKIFATKVKAKSYVQMLVFSPSRQRYRKKLLVNINGMPGHHQICDQLKKKAIAMADLPFEEIKEKLIALRDKILAGK